MSGGASLSLGEPRTAIVPISCAGRTLLAKLEGSLPTGSFKDRGSAALVASLRARGVASIVCDSSGNAGASLAAYCARAGIACTVYTPASASPAKLVQARAYGAAVVRVDGSRADATVAAELAAEETGSYYATHLREDAFLDGTQTFALELWEQLGRAAPAAVVVPIGGATLLLGIERGFRALLQRGDAEAMPALYGVQSERCDPLVRAFESEGAIVEPAPTPGPSIAEGLLLRDPPHGVAAIRAVRDSGGALIAVSEAEIGGATLGLARNGVFVEPTAAVAAAGAEKLACDGVLPAGTVVVGLTGTGLKAAATIEALLGDEGSETRWRPADT